MWGIRSSVLLALLFGCLVEGAEFSVATYNVRNYLVRPTAGRKAKTEEARAKVAEILSKLRADVVALQEVGDRDALNELRYRLLDRGVAYPFYELLVARDAAIRLAVLSRHPIVATRGHTNDQFLVEGSRQWVRRGFLEAEIEVDGDYRFTLLTAHLKSKLEVPYARQSELRKLEATMLRRRVEAILTRNAGVNLLVAGDLNDTPDSTAVRLILGRGLRGLSDASPPVRGGHGSAAGNWTHYYRRGDERARLDYVLMSRGMRREQLSADSFTADFAGWAGASDHRPVLVSFTTEDR